jgi:hypothetical protein
MDNQNPLQILRENIFERAQRAVSPHRPDEAARRLGTK